jgi:hypothetical protein
MLGCGNTEEKIADPASEADDDADDDSSPSFTDEDDDAPAGGVAGGGANDDVSPPGAAGSAADDDTVMPVDTADDAPLPMPTADDDMPVDPPADDDVPADDDTGMPAPSSGLGGPGATCESDGDCLSGLTCLDETQSYFGGVYPHGVCTVSCALDPFVCDGFASQCVGSEAEAWCVPLCQIGGTGVKCRADQACVLLDAEYSVGFCDAMCRDDMDCPEGLFCDGSLGLCLEEPAPGLEIGEPCTSGDECAGHLCLPPTPDGTSGVCSSFCNLSATLDPCRSVRETADPAPGACDPLTSIVVTGVYLAPGDVGICSKTCDVAASDCEPGWTCAELLPEVAEPLGHTGLCLFDELIAMPDAGAP